MHYQIYIPGGRGCDPQHLARVGLAELIDPAAPLTATDVLTGGPDGGGGVVFSWGHHPNLGYHRDEQLWTPCKRRGELAAGRFWMGQTRGDRPRPDELLRSNNLGGKLLKLADDREWLLPTLRVLPHQYGLDDDGLPVRAVKPAYQAWVDRGLSYFDLLLQWRQNEGGDLTVPEAWTFAIESLAMNYRVNADIVAWLGLLDDITILHLLAAVIDVDALDELEAQKKTADCTIPAG